MRPSPNGGVAFAVDANDPAGNRMNIRAAA